MSFIWGSMRAPGAPETGTAAALTGFLERCAELGCSQIDLADIYGRGQSEELVGQALSNATDLRRHYSLIAKAAVVFSTGSGPASAHHYRNDARHIEDSLSGTLQRLGTDSVDLFLVHRPDYLLRFEELARALERIVASGKARQVGLSNFPRERLAQLERELRLPLVHHQIEFSVLETSALDNGLLDDAQQGARTISAWSPFGGGRFFDPECQTSRQVRAVLSGLTGDGSDDGLAGAALAWIRHHPVSPIPILGGTRIGRIEQQLAAMDQTRFDHESWYAVLEASRGRPAP